MDGYMAAILPDKAVSLPLPTPGQGPGCWGEAAGSGGDVAVPQQCGSGGQDRRGVRGEDEDGCPLAEQLGGGGEADEIGGRGGQAAQAVFLHGGASVRDEP